MSRSEELRREVAVRVLAGLEALGAGRRDELLSYLTEDVALWLPDRPGADGARAVADALLAEGPAPGGEIDEVELSDDLGFVRWRRRTRADEERRGLCVVTRTDDGPWKVSRWIENRGTPSLSDVEIPAPAPTPSGPGFRLSLLGHPRVTVASDLTGSGDDEPEIRWPFQRALEILAFLALARDFEAARNDLVEAVWSEETEESIEKNFHPSVSHVRRSLRKAWQEAFGGELPQPVTYEGGLYRLGGDVGWWIDVVELARRLERGRSLRRAGDLEAAVHQWEAGRALYRGALLQGMYSPWTSMPREQSHRVYLDLLEESARAYAELDRLTQAMDSYRRILFEDPLRERVHVALMQIYGRQGRRDLVRRQYDRLTSLLQEELGVQPLPQTTEEYHRVMG